MSKSLKFSYLIVKSKLEVKYKLLSSGGKESSEFHSDFYILVKNKYMNEVRSKVKKLSKEFEFDIVSDSKDYSKEDYGFKIKYQGTTVGFFPYTLIDK